MGKKKSVVLIVLSTIVLAALVFISVASFPLGTPYYFQPLLGLIDLSTDLGGGYYTVYYPEGVISEKEYDALVADYEARLETPDTSDDVADPADEYTRHGGVYLSADITASDGSVTERFAAEFDTAYRILQERFEQKNLSGHAVKLQDDYTVRVEVPATTEDASTLFDTFAYSGELRFTDEHFETLMDGNARYVKSAEAVQMTEDTYGVAINFTAEGQARFYEVTTELAAAASSDSTGSDEHNHTMFYLCIGEDRLLYAEVSEAMNQPTVYISGSFNEVESAETVAVLINSALADEDVFSIELNAPYVYSLAPTMGENAGLWVAIAFGVLSLAMIVWSLVRYKGMGLAHVYGFLTFALVYILCISLIGGVALNIGGVLAILFAGAMMCGFDWFAFKNIRDEFATGKTLTSAIKSGYKKSLSLTLDAHIVLFLASLILYFASFGAAHAAALILMLGVVISAACTLGVTRFFLYIWLSQAKRKIAFCNFKREEAEEDE